MPTKMTATNTLNKGLVMDFNPLITKDDCLTNALNATLLTFNGNEMQLQQDMGNGRVETAFLPEGYVPVGTCEFGDIIYVVSYNPLENKSQIGCFPSPERNISSDEITDMQQSLAAADFQEFSGGSPTGVLKATSVKKILYGDKNMNPGDKYIIYEEATGAGNLENNASTLSDFGNTAHTLGTWPKLLKIKVVSIEESGKIVDLGASVKWYDNNYYLTVLSSNSTGEGKDIDSYRSLVSSAYSVFQSKVSGKLALLAELEAVESFSCTHDVFTEETANGVKHYIYFYTSWRTSHPDVNPSGFIITKSAWIETAEGGKLRIPQLSTEGGETVVRYKTSSDALDVPIKDGWDKDNNQWAVTQVKEYTRLYDLANPSSDYETYLTKNFDFLYKTQVTWNLGLGETGVSKDDLRPITRATRLLTEEGRPNEKREYVFNLDSYERDDSETIYKTKDRQGILRTLAKVQLSDDVINNYFGKDIPTLVSSSFIIEKYNPELEDLKEAYPTDLSNLIWNYSVAPVMPYGVLDWLTVNGTIDFSKLGSGEIDLTAWRYYVSGGVATLTWGLEAYPEPNKGIAEVHFDFYDNQGFAAGYKITGKSSYSGVFTDNIVLGQKNSSHRMVSVDAYNKTFPHAGLKVDKEDPTGEVVVTTNSNKPDWGTTPGSGQIGPWTSDTGTLHPNMLYLVRITVKYTTKDLMDNYDLDNETGFRTFWRWMWTNGIFNENYYSVADFENLQPQLGIDFSATFDTRATKKTNALKAYIAEYAPTSFEYEEISGKPYKTLGAAVYHINQNSGDDAKGNILLTLAPGLNEGFNTFNLNPDHIDKINNITVTLGRSSITKNIEQPAVVHTGANVISNIDNSLQPVIAKYLDSHNGAKDLSGYIAYQYGENKAYVSDTLLSLLSTQYVNDGGAVISRGTYSRSESFVNSTSPVGSATKELYTDDASYEAYLDSFSLNLVGGSLKEESVAEPITYLDSEGNEQKLTHYTQRTNITMAQATDGIQLTLTGIAFSKLFAMDAKRDTESKTLQSIMAYSTEEYNSVSKLGFHYYQNHLYFNSVCFLGLGRERGENTWSAWRYDKVKNGQWRSGSKSGGGHGKKEFDGKTHNPAHWDEVAHLQGAFKGAFSEAPVAAFSIGRFTENGDWDIDSKTQQHGRSHQITGQNMATIKKVFGMSGTYIYDDNQRAPVYMPESGAYKTASHNAHMLAIWDRAKGKWYTTHDWFISGGNNSQAKKGGTPVCHTLADMLGSLYIQLYAVTESEGNLSILGNITSLQPYTEMWNKDIIISVDVSKMTTSDIQDLLEIQQMNMKNYLTNLKANSDCPGNINELNTQIVLYGTQRVISFQFAVNYNLQNLPYIYEALGTPKHTIRLATEVDGQLGQTAQFEGNVSNNVLYTWTGSNIVPFGANSTLYYASEFVTAQGSDGKERIYARFGTPKKAIKSSTFAVLSSVIVHENGEVYWENLDKLAGWNSTRYVHWYSWNGNDGKDPKFINLPGASIFNEYK